MSEAYIAEIRQVAFAFAPRGWALCNGQTLPISQNQALFSILGTTYGGDGIRTFNLPNLQGCSPVHPGPGIGIGNTGGEATHALTMNEMPAHTHVVKTGGNAASPAAPGNEPGANAGGAVYAGAANGVMAAAAVSTAGGSQAHNNMQPYAVVNFIIALQGIFPSRS